MNFKISIFLNLSIYSYLVEIKNVIVNICFEKKKKEKIYPNENNIF
jgi:hypothetical protein